MDLRRELTAAGVVVIALGSPAAAARDDDRPRLGVHIKNYAEVRGVDLARARTEVERIFDIAGVQVGWVEADAPGGIAILLLRVTGDSRQDSAGCVLGLALRSRSSAYVFINRIIGVARSRPIDVPVVLGRIIAHELGHVLLPPGQHSSVGIMRADMDVGYTNPSRFTREQARNLQRRLRADSSR